MYSLRNINKLDTHVPTTSLKKNNIAGFLRAVPIMLAPSPPHSNTSEFCINHYLAFPYGFAIYVCIPTLVLFLPASELSVNGIILHMFFYYLLFSCGLDFTG